MTTLVLDRLWLNRLDTGEAISGWSADDRTQTFTNALDVRTYGNGRRRAISAAGETGELPFRLQILDRAAKDLMRTWKGVAVQVRDHRGQRWHGVFAEVEVGEWKDGYYAAQFTLQTISVTEGV